MKITFIHVGGIKKPYMKDAVSDYLKRIKRYAGLQTVEVKEEAALVKMPRQELLKKEAERISRRIKGSDYAVALDERGVSFTSQGLAGFFKDFMSHGRAGRKDICFIVGGPYGLHPALRASAQAVMSLSSMTLPHELAMLVLVEQVYRAFTIIKNEPYSH
ncbi:MAG: 23S rRNA (pseudouridine(1915)-N(3))-methyltransferase RlmH [Deltaproteobacteria bacterium]|nr:23S rRNA (pseudouridine(1915)-N(3))-methyltransferase RlmH [Deltaproteobacteria bacterium]